MATHTTESRRDRVTLAEDAGLGRLSGVSVLAGMLVGYGAFAILLGVAAAIAAAAGHDPGSFTAHDWRSAGPALASRKTVTTSSRSVTARPTPVVIQRKSRSPRRSRRWPSPPGRPTAR